MNRLGYDKWARRHGRENKDTGKAMSRYDELIAGNMDFWDIRDIFLSRREGGNAARGCTDGGREGTGLCDEGEEDKEISEAMKEKAFKHFEREVDSVEKLVNKGTGYGGHSVKLLQAKLSQKAKKAYVHCRKLSEEYVECAPWWKVKAGKPLKFQEEDIEIENELEWAWFRLAARKAISETGLKEPMSVPLEAVFKCLQDFSKESQNGEAQLGAGEHFRQGEGQHYYQQGGRNEKKEKRILAYEHERAAKTVLEKPEKENQILVADMIFMISKEGVNAGPWRRCIQKNPVLDMSFSAYLAKGKNSLSAGSEADRVPFFWLFERARSKGAASDKRIEREHLGLDVSSSSSSAVGSAKASSSLRKEFNVIDHLDEVIEEQFPDVRAERMDKRRQHVRKMTEREAEYHRKHGEGPCNAMTYGPGGTSGRRVYLTERYNKDERTGEANEQEMEARVADFDLRDDTILPVPEFFERCVSRTTGTDRSWSD